MASPQRQIPHEPRQDPRPELQNLQSGGVQKEVSSGWRFSFWWIWVLIIVGIWYVGFGWGNSGGWIWGHRNPVQTTNDAALSGPGVPILNAANKQPYVGQAFEIQNVPVEREAGPMAYWIGSRFNAVPMLVINASNPANQTANAGGNSAPGRATAAPAQNAAANAAGSPNRTANSSGVQSAVAAFQPHEWLDVTGKIVKAPSAAQAEQEWGLSDGDARELESEGAYIQATEMQPAVR